MASEAQKQELTEKVTALVRDRFGGDYGKAFAHYDANKDGRIDRAELGRMLEDAGIGSWLTRGAWASGIVAALDADKDKDRKSTRLNSSHPSISYAVFCLKKNTHGEQRGIAPDSSRDHRDDLLERK